MTARAISQVAVIAAALLGFGQAATSQSARAPEDGYDLWLRYRQISDTARLAEYRRAFTHLVVDGGTPNEAGVELQVGLTGLLGAPMRGEFRVLRDGGVLATTTRSPLIRSLPLARELAALGDEGFIIRTIPVRGKRTTVIAGNRSAGVLYGVFEFLRLLQTNQPVRSINVAGKPRIQLRLLDHWDNLDRSVERGYAGESLWDWEKLSIPSGRGEITSGPPILSMLPRRYRDYARANASIGINGTVLTNVNANAKILTPEYLRKVALLAIVFEPYNIKVYLTARFSAPIEIGGLKTADPLDPAVRAWWKSKADEIYRFVPNFGGFLVKANSEGQPGPQDYKRSHADGANMLAEAVGPHGGIVMWRAFVYSNDVPVDRVKQAYDEFKPLDGAFRENVLIQVKNGPLDFQPREPVHPLFGAMPRTPLMMEFQITKEYLGQDTHLVYLGRYFEEVLRSDTYAKGSGSTVAKVIDGSLHAYKRTGIAGVSNIGSDRNWTGSHFNQANWYAFGRLAWDPSRSSADVADEWIRMTFSNDPAVVARIRSMMLASREAVVNYMTPLGLAHIMATGHHYGPGPWADAGRPDWTPSYYHRADTIGIGFDRSPAGSNAAAQYFPPVRDRYGNRATAPDSLLLWFHHVRWNERLRSGRTVWDELVHRYNAGVDTVRSMQRTWRSLRSAIDSERFRAVDDLLTIQEKEARWWRDAALLYFQTFSRLPIPAGYEQPAHSLEFYRQLRCPPNPRKPRCEAVY